MFTKNKRLFFMLLAAGLLLCIPAVAMLFSDEVQWDSTDFIVMGILLAAVVFLCELILRLVKGKMQRVIFCTIIFGLFLLVWAELAVGIFGTPWAGN